ncbi:MAG: glycerate kinase [Lachnospiraceae bacterium]|jgi:glycerate kinase|nr:glycerate kinase [Lachnospiraceae bacterium]
MKIVIAIDSFKGSLSSLEAGNAIKKGILNVTDAQIIVKPLADGGEGTTAAIIEGLGGEEIEVEVMGPLGKPVKAKYGYLRHNKTAIIEMAAAAGIILENKKDPLLSTTYGVGELIKDAIKRGCRNFIIGIGGSATNDGGVGMLSALGFEFLDRFGNPVGFGGISLKDIETIRTEKQAPELKECFFQIACDVTNPLCGPDGCTYIYGPQKGVTEELKPVLDDAMRHYARTTAKFTGNDYSWESGAGAAGGLGFAFLSYLNSRLESGINVVLEATDLEGALPNADYVITGEGRLDNQTAMGKAPIGVAKLAKKHGACVIAFAGSIAKGASECNRAGIDAYFPILTQVVTLEEAMNKETAKTNLTQTAEQVFRLIDSINKKP